MSAELVSQATGVAMALLTLLAGGLLAAVPWLTRRREAFAVTVPESAQSDPRIARMRRVYDRCHDIRRVGAASVELCYTACGRLDAYMEHGLRPWDYAAGWLILEEAGGCLTDFTGGAPSLTAPGCDILATNGNIHPELLQLI